jgi:hypothetical protein
MLKVVSMIISGVGHVVAVAFLPTCGQLIGPLAASKTAR